MARVVLGASGWRQAGFLATGARVRAMDWTALKAWKDVAWLPATFVMGTSAGDITMNAIGSLGTFNNVAMSHYQAATVEHGGRSDQLRFVSKFRVLQPRYLLREDDLVPTRGQLPLLSETMNVSESSRNFITEE